VTVKFSMVVALVLTFVVHHFLTRRAAVLAAPRPTIGTRVRRWFDAAAIAVVGTMTMLGVVHLVGLALRGQV
jgi:hypothetical protein